MSQDELQKALRVARQAHSQGYEPTPTLIALGALLRAVEILADRKDKPATDKRIEELEKRLVERDAQYETLLRCKDAMGIPRDAFCDLPARIALLKANSVPPMTVDGKTPGEVLILAQHGCRPFQVSREMLESAELAAQAVLRAFGQPSQTPQDAVEALRRVRGAIDDELAKLGAEPPSEATTPTSDHVHDPSSCTFCDKRPANPSPVQYVNEVARYGTEVYRRAGLIRNDAGPPPDTSTESGLSDVVLREKS